MYVINDDVRYSALLPNTRLLHCTTITASNPGSYAYFWTPDMTVQSEIVLVQTTTFILGRQRS